MPIPQITVTPAEFFYLQGQISLQYDQLGVAATYADDALTAVARLNDVAPTVDLADPFAAQFASIEQFQSTSFFVNVATSLNTHVVNRGTTQQPGDNPSLRLNRWLSGAERDGITPTPATAPYADATLTSYTSMAWLAGTNPTLTRSSGSFTTDGFVNGMVITVTGANTSTNNGLYTVLSVTSTVLTLMEQAPAGSATDVVTDGADTTVAITGTSLKVSAHYNTISLAAGFTIDAGNHL